MADGTHISWTDASWNPITGCSVVSPGCVPCYAQQLAGTRLRNHPSRAGLTTMTKTGPVWNGQVRFNEQWLDQPLRWTRPRRIFVVAHGDLFHENVPDEWIDRVFAVMASSPRHTFQVLTKRPDRMLSYLTRLKETSIGAVERFMATEDYQVGVRARASMPADRRLSEPDPPTPEVRHLYDRVAGAMKLMEYHWQRWPLRKILLGTSIEDQKRADERLPHLRTLAECGWRTWVSYEPALGPVDWRGAEFVSWFVSGGQSSQGKQVARPSHPDWHRATRDFCAAHGIAYHFKQNGAWLHMPERAHFKELAREEWRRVESEMPGVRPALMFNVGARAAGAMLDGREHREFPT